MKTALTRRFAVGDGGPGTIVDVRSVGGFVRGAGGAGTVHHVAWRVPDDATQLQVREQVTKAGPAPDPGDRPAILPLGLFPRAGWRAV